ncbi:MAG TPA: S41 family peptidase [Bryobacteraceae bacterium]|nr:S41 family peptidase [Bryobacteraceae bacterium]
MNRAAAVFALLLPLSGQNSFLSPLSEPGISADGKEIAFVSGGDIWTVPGAGGEARLLVSHAATEMRPLYSPDGKYLAFTSTRTGGGDIYRLDLQRGDLKRLTFSDAMERIDGWSRDGRYIYFSTALTDVSGMQDVLRVSVDGGTPMPYSADRYASEYFAAPGSTATAVTTKGLMTAQWWRKGHSHIDETEIWLVRDSAGTPEYERVIAGGAKEGWPMWSADEKRIYFTSDRSGVENIWEKPLGSGSAKPLTDFKDGRVLWPSATADARTIVFERDFRIWRLDVGSRKASALPVSLRGIPSGPATEHLNLTSQFSNLALSPDGRKIAFTARGDIFAASAKDGGTATRVTTTPGPEEYVTWADSNRLTYVSYKNGSGQIFSYDLATSTETQLTTGSAGDQAPRWSPDGKLLGFVRGGRDVMVYDPATKQERQVAAARFGRPPLDEDRPFVWSPDSKWLAFSQRGDKQFRNIAVVNVAGGQPIPISYLPNVFGGSITWSPNGEYILFDTGQRTEMSRIARVDLIPRTPKFREDQFRDLFVRPRTMPDPVKSEPAKLDPAKSTVEKTETPSEVATATPAPKPLPVKEEKSPITVESKDVKIVAEGVRRRLSLLPLGMDATSMTVSPDGKWLLFTASAAGQQNIYLYSLDELSREPAVPRQLTSTPGVKSNPQFAADSKEVFYLENGRVQTINIDTRQLRAVSLVAETDIDFSIQKKIAFQQAWSYLNDWFYDPSFHGADWAALRAKYEPVIEGSKTPDEMRRVTALMIGELNASHLGISPPGGITESGGRLGLRFDRKEYEEQGRLRVTEVISLSPADLVQIRPGNYLLAVDSVPVDGTRNLDAMLEYKIDRRVVLTVANDAAGSSKRETAVRPCNMTTEKNLLYRAWVESRRDYVSKVSNGRLGYVHMPDMSANSLERFYLDLDVENHRRDGVVVDIRNNNGGFVNAYALDVLARRPYLVMTYRGFEPAPARSVLGQRALEKPTILVVNQHSLSDAEDFTEGYRALKLGKVVGQPTAGWIIYTSGTALIDGSVLRLPFIKITTASGENMERNPRPVDVAVDRAHGESYRDKDSQLDAAVKQLLQQLDSERMTTRSSAAPSGM